MDIISYKSITNKLNDRIFTDYFYRLMLIARSVFKWENLPNGIDEKWIEKYLFSNGACMFYKDDNLGLMVAKMVENSNLNHYDEPTKVKPFGTNYTSDKEYINNENCVIIRNNDEMIQTSHTIQLYAYKLTNIDQTINTNVIGQKMPTIIRCSEKQRNSLKHVISQRNDNEPVIWGDKSLDTSGIDVLKTDVPIVFDKLELQKHMVWNECLSFLGVNNANQDKKERLVDDEVQANNDQIECSFNVMLKAREKACELINNMFGLNVKVSRRNDINRGFEGLRVIPNNSEPEREVI
jgi:hypothetical protein